MSDDTAVTGEVSNWHVVRVLVRLVGQHRRLFTVVCLFSFLYTGLDLLQPLVFEKAGDFAHV